MRRERPGRSLQTGRVPSVPKAALLFAALLSATLALPLAPATLAQEQGRRPITGVRGEPELRAVLSLGGSASTPRFGPQAAEQTEAVHAPVPPPGRDRAGAVPSARTAPTGVAQGLRELAPLAPSPALTEDFAGLGDDNTRIPPDTHGAVGPGDLMVTLNTQIRVSDRDGTNPLDASLNGFWAPVGGGSGGFDPRVVYDPYYDKWITIACDDSRSPSSGLMLAVTQANDPRGAWNGYKIDVDGGNTTWADFPSIGFNDKWVVVQVNMFTFADSWVGSNIYVFDRAALYGGTATFTLIQDVNGFTQAPALTYDPAQSDMFLLEAWNSGLGALRLTRISGAVGSETLSVVGFPTGPAYQFVPPVQNHAPQLGSAQRIATNDARIQNLVFRNGALWTTHTVFATSPDRASIQWFQVSPLAAVLQTGRIDDTTGANFYAFPSVAVNKLGDALIGFSCFAGTRYASACYAFRRSGDAPNTFGDPATLKEGLASYYKVGAPMVNRWGDYSMTVVDPTNDVDLWTIQEYAELPSGSDRWGTWWGHLALPPEITIDDVALAEGNSGNSNFTFTISLSFPSTQLVEVDWNAGDGTATLADGDFLVAGGRASFPPGTTTQQVIVPVVGDTKLEANETFVVDLSGAPFGVIADAQGQGTILNDDPVPQMSIDDVQVVEGNAGTTNAVFTVSLSNPIGAPIQAAWSTAAATATEPGDYAADSGSVSFASGEVDKTLTVLVNGDVTPEPDETFHVNLSAPVNAVLLKSRGIGTILDDDGASNPDVTAFTVVSGGGAAAGSGRNLLQWVNPVGGNPVELRIRYDVGLGCTPPANAAGPSDGILTPPVGAAGAVQSFDHTGLALDTSYCYTFWVMHNPGPAASAGVSAIGRPFDATGRVKWKYSTGTGTTGVAPPTISFDGILAVDNSGDVHVMERSSAGGPWPGGPPGWNPIDLGSPSQARNPIVPLGPGVARAFITTQNGRVHSIDSRSGAVHWTTPLAILSASGAPAAIFGAFGGEHDAVFAGTSAGDDNHLQALDPTSGAVLTSFGPPSNLGIGPILGMPAVDYSRNPQNRVYFTSRQGTDLRTLWCLELGPAGPVSFSLKWAVNVGNISGSPVLRGGRVYVGTDAGEVVSVNADDGTDVRTLALGNGPIKDFVFPDRASGDVYVSTDDTVWRLTDSGGWTNQWGVAVPNPSVPVLRPGASHLYVGGGDGQLYQLTLPGGALTSLPLDFDPGSFGVGAPSYDSVHHIVHVGSVRGVFYAVLVQVPLP